MIEPALATSVDTITLRPLDTLALPLTDEPTLHLSDHAKYGQHDVAHLAARRDVRVEHGDARATLLGLVNQVEDVAGVAPEPVEAGDD